MLAVLTPASMSASARGPIVAHWPCMWQYIMAAVTGDLKRMACMCGHMLRAGSERARAGVATHDLHSRVCLTEQQKNDVEAVKRFYRGGPRRVGAERRAQPSMRGRRARDGGGASDPWGQLNRTNPPTAVLRHSTQHKAYPYPAERSEKRRMWPAAAAWRTWRAAGVSGHGWGSMATCTMRCPTLTMSMNDGSCRHACGIVSGLAGVATRGHQRRLVVTLQLPVHRPRQKTRSPAAGITCL